MTAYGQACPWLQRGEGWSQLPNAGFDQFTADFDVLEEGRAGTQLPKPPFCNHFGKSPKTKYRDVNSITRAGRWIFDKITPASRTVMLDERLTRLDLDATPFSA